MSNNDTVLCDLNNTLGDLIKFRGIAQHRIINTCKSYHKGLYRPLRIYQTDELIYYFMSVKFVDSNLGNSLFIIFSSGSF